MEKIMWVSEAFSQEAGFWRVGMNITPDCKIDKIQVEQICDTGDPYDFYVGRTENGEKIFAVRVSAANVGYK